MASPILGTHLKNWFVASTHFLKSLLVLKNQSRPTYLLGIVDSNTENETQIFIGANMSCR